MRVRSLAAVCLAVAGLLVGEARAAGDVEIAPKWKAGETRSYERVKSRRRTRGGKETQHVSGRTPVDLKVIEATDKGYVVRWTFGKTTSDDPGAERDPVARALVGLVEGMHVDLELDREATVLGVRNWKELQTKGRSIVETLAEARPGLDKETADRLRPALLAMMATRGQVEQLFTREPQPFFLAVGRTYTPGKPFEFDDTLPNPLGGPPFPAKARLGLKSYDPKTGRAVVEWTQATDPRATGRVIAETLKQMARRLGNRAPTAADLGDMKVEDRGEFVLDVKTGWPEHVTHTRKVTSGGSSQEDTLEIRRRP